MKATNAPVLRKTSAVKKCSLRLRYLCGIHARGSAVSRSNTETRHQSLNNTSIHTRRGCIWVSWCMVGCYCDAAAFLSVFTPSTSRWIVVRFSNLFVAVLGPIFAVCDQFLIDRISRRLPSLVPARAVNNSKYSVVRTGWFALQYHAEERNRFFLSSTSRPQTSCGFAPPQRVLS